MKNTNKQKKVIIADANENVASKLKTFLETVDGITVVGTTSNGAEALDLINELHPDSVLLDAFLPQLDALEILNRLSSMDTQVHTLVLSPSNEIADRILKAGASYFMVKPFDLNVIASRLKEGFVEPTPTFKQLDLLPESKTTSLNLSGDKIITDDLANVDITLAVSHILNQLTIQAHLKGYVFIRDAILLVLDNPNYIESLTKKVYPTVAEMNKTTSSRTERAIRHAISTAWTKNPEVISREISGSLANPQKPTNGEFIASIANKIRLVRGIGNKAV